MSIGVRITTLDGMIVDFKTYDKYVATKDNYILHSLDDKPACIVYHSNGVINQQLWYKKNKLHRDNDRPASIKHDNVGRLQFHMWCKEGKIHRDDDKPAIIKFTEEGYIWCANWYKEGE